MSTATLTFTQALVQAETQARTKLPDELHERLTLGVALVRTGQVLQTDDGAPGSASGAGTWSVASSSRPGVEHRVNGACGCEDAHYRAPKGLCKHRLAVYLARRTLTLMQAAPGVCQGQPSQVLGETQDGPATDQAAPAVPVSGIDPRHVVTIQGKPFVKFAGLLDLAHTRGLQALTVAWTYNDTELSLAHAVAVFPFGTFEESGDATTANVNPKVAPHFRRVALTRAAARCLRIALGLEICSVEELAE